MRISDWSSDVCSSDLLGITAEALNLLMAHPWPSNVRQLQNALFRAAVLCEGDALTPADFPQIAAQTGPMRKDETPNAQFSDEGIGIMLYQADGNIRALADIDRKSVV